MERVEQLTDRIIRRVNINLQEFAFDTGPYLRNIVPTNQLGRFYAFYGIWPHHPLYFHFSNSNLSGSYFLGKCEIYNSILYKSDIRGDELKQKSKTYHLGGFDVKAEEDEIIRIRDSFLIKTLVHSYSHDPEQTDLFLIKNTVSGPYANIHGSPVEGCFMGPFSTVDLTTLYDCIIGAYSYIQVGELSHRRIEAGQIWIRKEGVFDFRYQFPPDVLASRYIAFRPDKAPAGLFMDFAEDRKTDFQEIFDVVHLSQTIAVPKGASVNRYALVKGQSHVSENVLVAQRAFLEDAWLGKGANAQENCYISNSRLEGYDITAHGATIIYSNLGEKVFVGFNAFLQGRADALLTIGEESIVLPHTIIDIKAPLQIPPRRLVWGRIVDQKDLENHSISLEQLSDIRGELSWGNMRFNGNGLAFVEAFKHRIEHILTDNGAYFDGEKNIGHAQKGQNISFNIIQPYPNGELEGLYPTIDIRP